MICIKLRITTEKSSFKGIYFIHFNRLLAELKHLPASMGFLSNRFHGDEKAENNLLLPERHKWKRHIRRPPCRSVVSAGTGV